MDIARTRLPLGLPISLLVVSFLFLAVACSSGSDEGTPESTSTASQGTGSGTVESTPSATAEPEASPEASPTEPPPDVSPIAGATEPDGERILEAVRALTVTIGPRVAGMDSEKQAAAVIADWLGELGYEVELQEFAIGREIARSSSLTIDGADSQTVPTLPFANSGTGDASGPLVYADAGLPEDFPPETRGAVALVRRDGVVFFQDKVANAIAAGAAGVVIFNNEPGILLGNLDEPVPVPVVGISMSQGEDLLAAMDNGPVTAGMSVGSLSDATSYNVVAEPPGEDCETVTGGHYDSVQLAPGASDNASGTATVLEIAAILAHTDRMGANCFVLFGAEEVGLVGSAHYVSQLSDEERSRLKAMLNFDMVGVGDEAWWLIGDSELQERAGAIAEDLGIDDVTPSTLIRGLSSDHASFAQAGIPVIMFHRWEDPLLHTPQDVIDRVSPEYLEEAARMGIALLESLSVDG